MSKTTVVGSAPISFTTSEGKALSIPLSALSFIDSKIQIDKSEELSAIDKAELESWLKYLVKIETIKQGEKSAPNPAIAIKAIDTGEIGNSIQIEFNNFISDPTAPLERNKSTFDAVVRYEKNHTLSYDPVSETFIKKVLGTEITGGMQPGLVHIKDADTPDNIKPKAAIYKLVGGTDSQKSSIPIDKDPSGTNAFKLEVLKDGADGDFTTVTISNVSENTKTFMLTVGWEKTVSGINSTNLEAEFKNFSYLIKISKPRNAENVEIDYAIPDSGVLILNGGAEKKDAIIAKAIAFTS